MKETDSRHTGYRDEFGIDECWELDALEPAYIDALVRSNIAALIDDYEWTAAGRRETIARRQLRSVAKTLE